MLPATGINQSNGRRIPPSRKVFFWPCFWKGPLQLHQQRKTNMRAGDCYWNDRNGLPVSLPVPVINISDRLQNSSSVPNFLKDPAPSAKTNDFVSFGLPSPFKRAYFFMTVDVVEKPEEARSLENRCSDMSWLSRRVFSAHASVIIVMNTVANSRLLVLFRSTLGQFAVWTADTGN